jgi:HEAT repeat protein
MFTDKQQLYITTFSQTFVREFQFLADVLAGRAKAKKDFFSKLKDLLQLGIVELSDFMSEIINQANDERLIQKFAPIGAITDSVATVQLEALAEEVGREAARRWAYFINHICSDNTENSVILFAKVGAERALEYLCRERLPLSVETVLQGLSFGRSGAYIINFTNTKIEGTNKEIDYTAEGAYGRSGLLSWHDLTPYADLSDIGTVKPAPKKLLAHKYSKFKRKLKKLYQKGQLGFGTVNFDKRFSTAELPKYGYIWVPQSTVQHYGYLPRQQDQAKKQFAVFYKDAHSQVKHLTKQDIRDYLDYATEERKQHRQPKNINQYYQAHCIFRSKLTQEDLNKNKQRDFSQGDFSEVDFSTSTLVGLKFGICKKAYFNRCTLQDIDAQGSHLEESVLDSSHCINVNFQGSHLLKVKARYIQLERCDFTNLGDEHELDLRGLMVDSQTQFGHDLGVQIEQFKKMQSQHRDTLQKLEKNHKQQVQMLGQFVNALLDYHSSQKTSSSTVATIVNSNNNESKEESAEELETKQSNLTSSESSDSQQRLDVFQQFECHTQQITRALNQFFNKIRQIDQMDIQIQHSNRRLSQLDRQQQKRFDQHEQRLQALESKQSVSVYTMTSERLRQIYVASVQYHLEHANLPSLLGDPAMPLSDIYVELKITQEEEQLVKEQQFHHRRKSSVIDDGNNNSNNVDKNKSDNQDEVKHSVKPKATKVPLVREKALDYYRQVRTIKQEKLITPTELFEACKKQLPEESLKQENDNHDYNKPNTQKVTTKAPEKLLIVGAAGTGKSTLSQYLAYQHAIGQWYIDRFDIVFTIPLRLLLMDQYRFSRNLTLAEVILDLCFKKEDRKRLQLKPQDIEWLLQHHRDRICLILDGFDEVGYHYHQQPNSAVAGVIKSALGQRYVIMTSRPYLIHQFDIQFDQRLENIGFSAEQIQQYIERYFNQRNQSEKGKQLKQFMAEHSELQSLMQIPLNLRLFCLLFRTNQFKQLSLKNIDRLTIYEKLSLAYAKYYLSKYRANQYQTGIEALDSLQDAEVKSRCQTEWTALSALAFAGLKAGQPQLTSKLQKKVIKDIANLLIPNAQQGDESLFDRLLKTGLLKTIHSGGKQKIDNPHYFPHLTLQEYFAATYVAIRLCLPKNNQEFLTTIEWLRTEKYEHRYQVMLPFVAGLLYQHWQTQQDPVPLQSFWKAIQSPPRDLIGLHHMRLVMQCLEACKADNSLPIHQFLFKQIDGWLHACFIGQATWFSEVVKLSDGFRKKFTSSLVNCSHVSRLTEKESKSIQMLVKRLEHKDGNVRRAVVNALGELKVQAPAILQELVKRLEDKDRGVRRAVVNALGQLKVQDLAILQELLKRLEDKDWYERWPVVHALGKLKVQDPAILQELAKRLEDRDWRVRREVVKVLGQLKVQAPAILQELVKRLEDEAPVVREAVVKVLGELKVQAPAILQELAKRLEHKDWRVCQAVVNALGELKVQDPVILQELVKRLEHKDGHVRWNVVYALGELKVQDPVILQELVKRLEDKDGGVCLAAVYALGELKVQDPVILQELAKRLEHKDGHVREAVVDALGKLKVQDPAILQELVKRLEDEEWLVRRAAVDTLGNLKMQDPVIIQALAKRLKDKDEYVRRAVVNALGELKVQDPVILQELVKRLKDWDRRVRREVVKVLGQLKVQAPAILQELVKRLEDEAPVVREAVVKVLGELKVQAPAILQELVKRLEDEDSDVREVVVKVLGELKVQDSAILQELVKRLEHKDGGVRWAAVNALGQLKVQDLAILQELVKRLEDEVLVVREAVVKVLGQLKVQDPKVIALMINIKLYGAEESILNIFNNYCVDETYLTIFKSWAKSCGLPLEPYQAYKKQNVFNNNKSLFWQNYKPETDKEFQQSNKNCLVM